MKKKLTWTNILIIIIILAFIIDLAFVLSFGDDIPVNIVIGNIENEQDKIINTTLGEVEKTFKEYNMPFTKNQFIAIQTLIAGGIQGPISEKLAIVDTRLDPSGYNLYRHFTVLLTHAGVLHLIVNMIGLYIAGNFLEKKIGGKWVIIFMLISTFLCSYISDLIWLQIDNNFVIGQQTEIGASGGVFGLIGCSLAICLLKKSYFKDLSKTKKIILAIYGIVFTYLANSAFVSWTMVAHNVGFIIGIILILIINKTNKKFINN